MGATERVGRGSSSEERTASSASAYGDLSSGVSVKFPTLARMARDILVVPATTVASEAAFSVGGRVIDETPASLLPDIIEALMTCNDWIESPNKRKRDGETSENF
ncbi:hypothetical protein Vadar_010515 [Vaccinium darrowii]|uniref:Uncharacterized protein n=1 Tax=Vaccinium darrowii TaxID=229202 RepID=A0ACB7YWD4_9ERIC|nr:hypothetical protein Vadar_010515 [Vaccinium darrowii]